LNRKGDETIGLKVKKAEGKKKGRKAKGDRTSALNTKGLNPKKKVEVGKEKNGLKKKKKLMLSWWWR
jgi:hypothetical protein